MTREEIIEWYVETFAGVPLTEKEFKNMIESLLAETALCKK
jgi:hypothetical protein